MSKKNPSNDQLDPIRAESLRQVAKRIDHEFKDLRLLDRALTHSSLGNEGVPSYERLEFLGDAILGFLVADRLHGRTPEIPVGELTERRALLVSRQPLAQVAEDLDLGRHLLVGRGLSDENLRSKRIQADLVEAVLAAIYLDGGLNRARRFVRCFILERFRDHEQEIRPRIDPKTRLNQLAQAHSLGPPTYEVLETTGPDHEPRFRVSVTIGDLVAESEAASNKQAGEQEAAEKACEILTGEKKRDGGRGREKENP